MTVRRWLAFALCGLVACTQEPPAQPYLESTPSPLEVFFEGADQERAAQELHITFERELGQCMRNAGFVYVERPLPRASTEAQTVVERNSREYAEASGYGIVLRTLTTPAALEDPNLNYIVELSDVEYLAYQTALVGPVLADVEFITGTEDIPLADQGCYGTALIQSGSAVELVRWTEFSSARDDAIEALQALPSMISAGEAWSVCMSEQGYDFANQAEILNHIAALVESATTTLGDELAGISDEEIGAFLDGAEVNLTSESEIEDRLLQVAHEERRIAVADFDCYVQHVRSTFEPLRDEVELSLIDAYQPALEAIRDK